MASPAVGARFKHARKRAGLTQEQAARAVGVSRGTIQNWEAGRRKRISASHMAAAAEAYDVPLSFLTGSTPAVAPDLILALPDGRDLVLELKVSPEEDTHWDELAERIFEAIVEGGPNAVTAVVTLPSGQQLPPAPFQLVDAGDVPGRATPPGSSAGDSPSSAAGPDPDAVGRAVEGVLEERDREREDEGAA